MTEHARVEHVDHAPLDFDDPHRAALEDNPKKAERLPLKPFRPSRSWLSPTSLAGYSSSQRSSSPWARNWMIREILLGSFWGGRLLRQSPFQSLAN
ncbi:uncharacterized protein Z518_00368 [Rhinocladiella mackenziei CBS 650.93]|uniref:Uncharacterized protein n=1 Tax=Rhinocladiella mackenziei CBS 650.93 TaxID=1442369 RepID=A0A0D2ITA8_9EURO|nr:uncharacterized protein Z518_00368 [Rhinocladiella mackenziei CBS 650.93]KIX09289.1 hypothetical protein Z518_00368 [Rhinocladiella mackenziei CBS 650.93]